MIWRKPVMKWAALLIAWGLAGCSGNDNGDPAQTEPPGTATLLAPENNTVCLTGVSTNAVQTEVDFSWNSAQNTDSYDLVVKNLNSGQTTTYNSGTNSIAITLEKGEPYSWYVVSRSDATTETAESTLWKFYLAGEGETHYAPFPASLVHPASGATVFGSPTFLEWEATDVDGDIESYEVYMDQADGSTLLQSVTVQRLDNVAVEPGKIYYWKVLARDGRGNVSDSGVFTFKAN